METNTTTPGWKTGAHVADSAEIVPSEALPRRNAPREESAVEAVARSGVDESVRASRRWLAAFFGVLLTAGGFLIPNYLFLCNTHELLDVREIAARQQAGGGRYGSALVEFLPQYKLALLRARKPEIVALGSSRMMLFRQEDFTAPFANLGGAVQSIDELARYIALMLNERAPKIILLGADPWWFNGVMEEQRSDLADRAIESRLSPANLFKPFEWMHDSKLGPGQYAGLVAREADDYGVQAVIRKSGFDPDGSYRYQALLSGEEPSKDERFQTTEQRINRGTMWFKKGPSIDRQRLHRFMEAVGALRGRGIRVVTLLPPFPPSTAARFVSENGYAYVAEVRRALAGPDHFDFHDAGALGSPDCEFIDGLHGGDVTVLRMLEAMASTSPTLAPLIDRPRARALIEMHAGHASADQQVSREVDFLRLGCEK